MTTRRSFIKNTSAATAAIGLGASMSVAMSAPALPMNWSGAD